MQASSGNNGKPSFRKHPLRWVWWWLTRKPPTSLSGIVIAVVVTLLGAAGITALITFVVKAIVPDGRVPGYLLTVVGGVFLTLGCLSSWLVTRAIYQERLTNRDDELEADKREQDLLLQARDSLIGELEAKLALAEERLLATELGRVAATRIGMYFTHVYNAVEALIRGDLSLKDLDSNATSHWICATTQKWLREAIEIDFWVSLWVEQPHPIERLPRTDRIGERLRTFEIAAAPMHEPEELEDFGKVHVDPSWLKHNYRQEQEDPKNPRYRSYVADRLDLVGLRGPDLDVFKQYDYKSARATSFRHDDKTGYLVILSKEEQPFSIVEDVYLLWLRHVLELDFVLRSGQRLAPAA